MGKTSKETEEKKSFIMYYDYEKHISILTPEQRGYLLSAIFKYANEGVIDDDLDIAVKVLMSVIAAQMERDNEKYQETVQKRSESGKAGGKKTQENRRNKQNEESSKNSESQSEANQANASFACENHSENQANQADNDNVNENDNDNDNDNVTVNVTVNGNVPEEESDTYTIKDSDLSSFQDSVTNTEVASLSLPLRDGKELPVTRTDISRYENNFPNVPIEDELYAIKRWLSESSSRRRSSVDTMRLVHNWLSKREQINTSARDGTRACKGDASVSALMKNLDSYLAEHPDEGRWLTDD